eukprot:TRINITY_DN28641_c0_g1_i3.p1 TRINITY_DN28641_c0_g1~~TRINITY_DN28641_c0_g1_i3.p1  ORF type:complete len:264 (-),score=7.31 TRINITY_DN28641_c0_g1_i3:81-872(-)
MQKNGQNCFQILHLQKNLQDLMAILAPFKFSCDKITMSQFPTLSLAYPFLYYLYEATSKKGSTQFETEKAAAAAELKAKWEEISLDALVASFLDPRVKSLTFLKEEYRKRVIEAVKTKCPESQIQSEAPPEPSTSLSAFFGGSQLRRVLPKTEFETYLDEPEVELTKEFNPLEWWKARQEKPYPNLAPLAEKYLSIPSSTVSVERLFSRAGNVVTKKRTRLAPDVVNDLLILKMRHYQRFFLLLFSIYNFCETLCRLEGVIYL